MDNFQSAGEVSSHLNIENNNEEIINQNNILSTEDILSNQSSENTNYFSKYKQIQLLLCY
jgi:hypothetical protein